MIAFDLTGSATTSTSATRTVPLVGSDSPAMMRMVVVLPAPLGPRKPKISPRSAVSDNRSTAVKSPYFFVRSSITIIGVRLSSRRLNLQRLEPYTPMAEREQLDDRTLVTRILEGDRDLFTTLVSRYEKRVINYVYRITHRYEEAHDLAQDIFVKVYLALDRYDPKYQFSTWLFRIAQNSAIDALRKKAIVEVPLVRPSEEEPSGKEREFADDGVSPYRALKNKQLSAAIDQAVEKLPADYRELIQLRHFAEMSYEEIASMKKLPLGTVKNKLFRARNLLKDALGSFVEPL